MLTAYSASRIASHGLDRRKLHRLSSPSRCTCTAPRGWPARWTKGRIASRVTLLVMMLKIRLSARREHEPYASDQEPLLTSVNSKVLSSTLPEINAAGHAMLCAFLCGHLMLINSAVLDRPARTALFPITSPVVTALFA